MLVIHQADENREWTCGFNDVEVNRDLEKEDSGAEVGKKLD